MNSESFLHQKKVRTMGIFLAIVSCLALIFSLLLIPYGLLWSSSQLTTGTVEEMESFSEEIEGMFAEAVGVSDLSQFRLSEEELKEVYAETYDDLKSELELPEDATKEDFIDTMLYLKRVGEGEDIPMPEENIIREWVDPTLIYLPENVDAETTVLELVEKDIAFFEDHKNSFRFLSFLAAALYAIIALIILQMALAWKQGDPFGKRTILGLRWLAILYIGQFVASFAIGPVLPHAEYDDLLFHASIYQLPIDMLFGTGANLSCGLVLLTLSWVLEHGRKMKDEQALTI